MSADNDANETAPVLVTIKAVSVCVVDVKPINRRRRRM